MTRHADLMRFQGETIEHLGVSPDDGVFWMKTTNGMLVIDPYDIKVYRARKGYEKVQPDEVEASRQDNKVPAEDATQKAPQA